MIQNSLSESKLICSLC